MPYRDSSYGYSFRSSVTKWVRWLLIANTALFALTLLGQWVPGLGAALGWLVLRADAVLFRPWTVLTYAFLHAGVGHWFFNMLGLFFFGPRLEERWGASEFIKFYLICAAGGAVFSFIDADASVVGASAAINGLLMAWALYWPTEEVLFFGIFPIQIRWLVVGMGLFSVFSAASGSGGGIAHLAHIGGFAAAYLYLKSRWAPPAWGELPARRKPKKQKAVVPWGGKKEAAASAAPQGPAGPGPTDTRRASRAEKDLLDDVDRILDKISAHGLASLTPEERARLDEVSKRYRTN